jgi:hypothetical protein
MQAEGMRAMRAQGDFGREREYTSSVGTLGLVGAKPAAG